MAVNKDILTSSRCGLLDQVDCKRTNIVLRKETFDMSIDIARAWKDATYRASLSAEEQAMIPANPAGAIELSDAELELVHGAGKKEGGDVINNFRFETNGAVCIQSLQVGVQLSLISALSPSTLNQVCN
jgi:mersacidin/lichenicidin family type 2 lantibiotic